jgi:hypothetical protein
MLARAGHSAASQRLDAAVAWTADGQMAALRLGSSLRLFGMRAVVDTQARALAPAREWAGVLSAANLLHCGGGDGVAWAPAGGRLRRLPAEQVVARLATERR